MQTALRAEKWLIGRIPGRKKKIEERRRGTVSKKKNVGCYRAREQPRNDADQFLALVSGKLDREPIPHRFYSDLFLVVMK